MESINKYVLVHLFLKIVFIHSFVYSFILSFILSLECASWYVMGHQFLPESHTHIYTLIHIMSMEDIQETQTNMERTCKTLCGQSAEFRTEHKEGK